MTDMPSDDDFGRLERAEGGEVRLRFERRFPQPPDTVWRALTEPEQLQAWFPTTIEGERVAGAPLRLHIPTGSWRRSRARCSPASRPG